MLLIMKKNRVILGMMMVKKNDILKEVQKMKQIQVQGVNIVR